MNDQTSLAIRQPITPTLWQMIEAIAPTIHASRLFGVASKDQAAVIMLKGAELKIGLAASFEFIQVIQGKPTLSPRGALALIHQSGQLAGMKITDEPGRCTVWMKRTNGFEYQITWATEDAQKAGLVTKAGTTKTDGTVREAGNWEKYQANMLRWRAVGFCADVVFPDVIGGMKRADEFGAIVNEAGDVVEGQWSVSEPTTPVTHPTEHPAPTVVTLGDLIAQYSAENIMAANNGTIPGTDDEVARVAERLAANG